MASPLLPNILRSSSSSSRFLVTISSILLSTALALGCSGLLSVSARIALAQSTPVSDSTQAPTNGAPRLVFTDPVYDFGTVEQGAQVTHLFRFTNQGGQDLRIESVKTSCGCTAAVISSETISPRQEGTISATFDTAHYAGEKTKSISVYSNDPAQLVSTLTLQGQISVEVEADPPQLYLGRVRHGEETIRSVDILYDANKPIAITKIEKTSPMLTVETQDLERGERKGKKLIVTLKKDAPLGRLSDEIKVTTSSEKRPMVEIPVFGSIEGDLVVTPPQVSFGVLRRGEGKSQDVSIKSRSTKPIHIVNVKSSNADIATELTTVKDGEEYKLTVSVKNEGKPGRIQGEVQMTTDHPAEKVLSLPLYGMIADGPQAKQ